MGGLSRHGVCVRINMAYTSIRLTSDIAVTLLFDLYDLKRIDFDIVHQKKINKKRKEEEKRSNMHTINMKIL